MSRSSYISGSSGTTPSSPPPERPGSAVSSRLATTPPPYMNQNDIERGLRALDKAFGENEFIEAVAPIRMVAIGGLLAVSLFQNRVATKDLDIMIDPHVWIDHTYQEEIHNAITAAADPTHGAGLPRNWLNDQIRVFFKEPAHVFFQSMEQNIVVYAGDFLTVYAADLSLALEMKLRRLEHSREKERFQKDEGDAVAIVKYMVEKQRGNVPLTVRDCEAMDHNGFHMPVKRWCIRRVQDRYLCEYKTQGIVALEERDGRLGYIRGDEWVWWRSNPSARGVSNR